MSQVPHPVIDMKVANMEMVYQLSILITSLLMQEHGIVWITFTNL